METFKGDVESWSRFWGQFRSSNDVDASLSTINKHVFLRGYLEGEPKMLVDRIAVTGNTYEETQHIAVFFANTEATTPEIVTSGARLPARNAGGGGT